MKVLIPLIDEGFGKRQVEFVASHNWPASAEFKIVYVLEPWQPVAARIARRSQPLQTLFMKRLRLATLLIDDLNMTLEEGLPEAKVSSELLYGSPAEEIIETARTWGADVIVIGSHGSHRYRKSLPVGTVAATVASNAPCSVMVVKPDFCEQQLAG